jgi:hypothetical protein
MHKTVTKIRLNIFQGHSKLLRKIRLFLKEVVLSLDFSDSRLFLKREGLALFGSKKLGIGNWELVIGNW